MNESNKEFEDWWLDKKLKEWNYTDAPMPEGWGSSYKPNALAAWLACQKLNDARINTLNDAITEDKILESHNRELLAANQVMREALQGIIEHEEMYSEGFKVKDLSSEALLNADNSTLVNAGYLSEDGLEVFLTMGDDINPWSCGEPVNKLYTIQTKSNTEYRMI